MSDLFPSQVKSGCGVFGILRKYDAPKIPSVIPLTSIECVRYRGSRLGAGFARFDQRGVTGRKRLKVFADSLKTIFALSRYIADNFGLKIGEVFEEYQSESGTYGSYVVELEHSDDLDRIVREVNRTFSEGNFSARVYCWGDYVDVSKGVGYPKDIHELYNLAERSPPGDLWLAHTRQPTNSPGMLPVWSHPFSSGEWAIVHNGDISSFGSNMEFLFSVGYRSFVGTDSEVIAYLLDHLTSKEGLSIEEAAALLCNGFEDFLNGDPILPLRVKYRGAALDGPFTVVAGHCDGSDVYLLALTDRFKFRPIVIGEDDHYYYVASEEAEIRAVSSRARVWTLGPGDFFLASMNRGVIHPTEQVKIYHTPLTFHQPRPRDGAVIIDTVGSDYRALNSMIRSYVRAGIKEIDLVNVNGQRYIGAGIEGDAKIRIYGTPGNCLANYNQTLHFEVFGNAQDDVGDAMYGGSVVIHGDCRDVLGQVLQGGYIYVMGDAGNRCGIQMREFRDRRPFLIIGGKVDDYLGEYMAGGVIVVLGLGQVRTDRPPVGRYVATGMVGGRIYIRGRVPLKRIGLNPVRADVLQYLEGLVMDGLLTAEQYETLRSMEDLSYITLEEVLPSGAYKAVSRLFTNKYFKPLRVEYRYLTHDDLSLIGPHLNSFGSLFNLTREIHEVTSEKFTVIEPR
ncbi:MAG: glutamate synthase [Aigarchaeota archaeon]|nr:glutamate synthase [Aigarchaeota archaeon]MDW8092182.1 glutamate synthase [Nitrososphaerota archaeon]